MGTREPGLHACVCGGGEDDDDDDGAGGSVKDVTVFGSRSFCL